MRRLLLAVALFLAGALINVGVAWLCVMCSDVSTAPAPVKPVENDEGQLEIRQTRKALGHTRIGRVFGETDPVGPDTQFELRDLAGWPLRSLTCTNTKVRIRGGIALSDASNLHWRALPLTPLWKGFIVDTVVYALLLLGIFTVVRVLVRRHRRRRGLCPACGHAIGRSTRCSECGQESGVIGRSA